MYQSQKTIPSLMNTPKLKDYTESYKCQKNVNELQ